MRHSRAGRAQWVVNRRSGLRIIERNKALQGGLMQRLHLLFRAHQIDRARYCTAPDEFDFDDLELLFVPRTTPDDKADLVLGEDGGEDEFIIATANADRPL